MSKLIKIMIKRISAGLLIASLVLLSFPTAKTANAGNLTAMSDTMSRLKASTAANHLISFTMTAGTNLIQDETITVTFAAGFTLTGIDCTDVDITDDGADEDIQEEASTCTTATATEWAVTLSGQVLTLTAPSGAATYINGSSVVTIEIGTNATADEAGNEQITNATAGSQTISIGGTFGDTGTLAVPIMSEDQVTVSATVDPSITSSLSASTCALGTLVTSAINVCSYTNTVSTNATSGYVSTIVENGNLLDGSNDIDDAAGDNDVDQGSEEYGVSSNDTTGTQDIIDSTGCNDTDIVEAATAITGTAKVYADSGDGDSGPVSAAVTTVCHLASIAATTPAGSYSHIVTHITTGTF